MRAVHLFQIAEPDNNGGDYQIYLYTGRTHYYQTNQEMAWNHGGHR